MWQFTCCFENAIFFGIFLSILSKKWRFQEENPSQDLSLLNNTILLYRLQKNSSLWICGFICQNVFRYACILKKKNGFCVTFLKYPIHLVFNFVSRTVTYYILSSVYGLAKFVTKTHITHHTSLFICIFYKMNNQFQCDVENTQLN